MPGDQLNSNQAKCLGALLVVAQAQMEEELLGLAIHRDAGNQCQDPFLVSRLLVVQGVVPLLEVSLESLAWV
jgi:hypothetical protein